MSAGSERSGPEPAALASWESAARLVAASHMRRCLDVARLQRRCSGPARHPWWNPPACPSRRRSLGLRPLPTEDREQHRWPRTASPQPRRAAQQREGCAHARWRRPSPSSRLAQSPLPAVEPRPGKGSVCPPSCQQCDMPRRPNRPGHQAQSEPPAAVMRLRKGSNCSLSSQRCRTQRRSRHPGRSSRPGLAAPLPACCSLPKEGRSAAQRARQAEARSWYWNGPALPRWPAGACRVPQAHCSCGSSRRLRRRPPALPACLGRRMWPGIVICGPMNRCLSACLSASDGSLQRHPNAAHVKPWWSRWPLQLEPSRVRLGAGFARRTSESMREASARVASSSPPRLGQGLPVGLGVGSRWLAGAALESVAAGCLAGLLRNGFVGCIAGIAAACDKCRGFDSSRCGRGRRSFVVWFVDKSAGHPEV